jgi:hypothetical protein
MTAEPAPELALLLMASSPNALASSSAPVLEHLARQPIRWDLLYQLAAKHRVIPVLYQTLRPLSVVPIAMLASLQQECRAIAVDNLLKLREYQQVADLLTQHGIDHIAFKGIYLARSAYPSSSLRSIGDLDLLVDRLKLHEAIQLLQDFGYTLGRQYQHYQRYPEPLLLADLHEVSLYKPASAGSWFDIDLHWEVNCLFKELSSLQLDDVRLPADRVLENQVVLLVVHHGLINLWQRLGYVNDLYFLLQSGAVDWHWLLDRLATYQVKAIFLVGLHWCQQRGGLRLPAFVEWQLDQEAVAQLAQVYERTWGQVELLPADSMGLNQVRLMASTQARWQERLNLYRAYAQSFVFRSKLIMFNQRPYYIARRWGPLTALGRGVRFLYRRLVPGH